MDTFDAIEQRRSVKHYDTNHKFTDDEINQLMSLAVLSPTSFNMQNWRFVIIKILKLENKFVQQHGTKPK